jgi:hypothetical protein
MKEMKVKLSDLRMDEELLRLRKVGEFTVSVYRQNYRAGAQFPPLLVDTESMTIVSGNHRYSAMLQEYGADYEITVNIKKYGSRLELLKDFTKENVSHGEALTGISKRMISFELVKNGATPEEVASIFNVSVKRIMHWGDEVVMVTGSKKKSGSPRPVKFGLPMEKVSEEFYEKHMQEDRGISVSTQVKQLIRWIKEGSLSEWDEESINALEELKSVLDELNVLELV